MLIFNAEEIQAAYKNVLTQLKVFVDTNGTIDLQKIASLKFKDKCDTALFELLLSYMVKAESVSPGSPDIIIGKLLSHAAQDSIAVTFNRDSLDQLLSTFAKTQEKSLILDALTVAGLHGKIILSPNLTNGDQDLVELSTGSFFTEVQSVFSLKSTKFFDPKILCIDGFIESVSEIHRVLEDAAQSKETIIMFLRGLSDEVTHTLKTNYDRGTLAVIPVIIKYDLEGANLLNDIATVAGGDVISSLKGQLISLIDISLCPRVQTVDITSSGVLIENSATALSVDRHIYNLQEKILESNLDATKEIISRRVQSLGTRRVTIRLRDTQNKAQRTFMIDRCLRAVKSAATFGVGQWNGRSYPLASVKAGSEYAKKFTSSVCDLGVVIAQPAAAT